MSTILGKEPVFNSMGNPPRRIEPDRLYEITTRTLQSRLLLRPSRQSNSIIQGIIARAATVYGMNVCYFVAMSNHLHLLLRPEDALQLARFMNYVNANIAKEIGRLHQWKQKFWGRRYKPIPFTDEAEAQVAGLRYLLAHGCKEGLVRKPCEWPGASGLEALQKGKPLTGKWFDRTAEYYARRSGEQPRVGEFSQEESLELTPIPCWDHLSPEEIQNKVLQLVQLIEQETRDRFQSEDRAPMGARRVRNQNPHHLPSATKKAPAPIVHAASLSAWIDFKEAWLDFLARYRGAANRFKAGDPNAVFPPGCFPPRGEFLPLLPVAAKPRAGPA